MPLQYIIDAYNTTNHTAFAPIRKKDKDPHKAILGFIRTRMRGKSLRNRIILVFDGYRGVSQETAREPGIETVFSEDETADAVIKRMVERSNDPRNIAVVSDDREIRFFVRSCGAHPVAVDEFINPEEKPHKKREEPVKTELNYSEVSRINQELKKLWLKD